MWVERLPIFDNVDRRTYVRATLDRPAFIPKEYNPTLLYMSTSEGGMSFTSTTGAAAAGTVLYDPSTLYDSPLPGGGQQYFYRRLEQKGEAYLLTLGAGAFATTMDCVRVLSGTRIPVAIKQVSLDKRAADLVEKAEVRGMKALSGGASHHPHIVKFLSMFRGDDGGGRLRLSFVFERCPLAVPFPLLSTPNGLGAYVPSEGLEGVASAQGCDLSNNPHLPPGTLTIREAMCIMRQVLHALAHLHTSSPPVIHRDIKPENILLWACQPCPTTGERMATVKLTDYGTIRTWAEEDLTVGSGTFNFMAPEVAESHSASKASYTTSVDVFSAGATLFYIVSGVSPSPKTRLSWEERMGGGEVVSWELSRKWYKAHKPQAWEAEKTRAAAAVSSGGGGEGKVKSTLPHVSVLDFHFPPGSKARAFLEGLLAPVGTRLSSTTALKWLAEEWKDLADTLPPLLQQ